MSTPDVSAKYEDRFRAERPETFDALNDVWRRRTSSLFGAWTTFGRAALGEKAMRDQYPKRVQLAQRLMRECGYHDGRTPGGGLRWLDGPEGA